MFMRLHLPLLPLLVAACLTNAAIAATTEEALREVNSLLQMGKPEQAYVSASQLAKANPDVAPSLRALADQALKQTMQRAEASKLKKNNWEAVQLLRAIWPVLIDPSAAGPLYANPEAYNASLLNFYNVLLEATLGMSRQHQRRGDIQRALMYAEYCIAYKPSDPDPQAVKLRDELQAQVKARPLAASGGITFQLLTPDDDGYAGEMDKTNKCEIRLGGVLNMAGVSFPDIAIPKGAKIKSARVRGFFVKLNDLAKPPFQVTIQAEDTAQGVVFGPMQPFVKTRPKMQQMVQWWVHNPVQGWQDSPDIAKVIQPVINRPDWQKGNRLNLIFSGGRGASDWISFEEDPQRAFQLVVEWQ